jgi:hypothetical protein
LGSDVNPLDAIEIKIPGLAAAGGGNGVRLWHTLDGDVVGLHYFALPPDLPADLDSLEALRVATSQRTSAAGSAIVEITVTEVDGCRALRQVVKVPQRPFGMIYRGSLTLPFRDFSFVAKVQCQERSLTGLRDAMVLDQKLRSGEVRLDPGHGGMDGWMKDPYGTSGLARSLADDENYDERFPGHPLSRARRCLNALQSGIAISDRIRTAAPFVLPPERGKPWWKLW